MHAVNGSSDYEDHLLPSQKVHTGVLKMRGLPFAATPEDIVYWFNSAGLPIQPLTSERSASVMPRHLNITISTCPLLESSILGY